MLKNYILGTEIAKEGEFHIANISMLLKEHNLIEGTDYLKYGGITLINKESLRFPKYITNLIDTMVYKNSYTDLSELLPMVYFTDLLENNTRFIEDKFKEVQVDSKKFVKVTDKKLSSILLNDSIVKSVVENSEIKDLINENFILGHIKLSNKKSLTWY